MLSITRSQSISGRASVMAIFIGVINNSGQVSACGDACGGCLMHPEQHLALFDCMAASEREYEDFILSEW